MNISSLWKMTLATLATASVALTAGTAANAVTVTETATPINVGGNILDTEIVNNGKSVWVPDSADGKITVIDTKNDGTRSVLTFPAGAAPTTVAFSNNGLTAFVGDYNLNTVYLVDVKRMRITGSVAVTGRPSDIRVSINGKFAYVAGDTGVLSRITLKPLSVSTLTIGGTPTNIALTNNGKTAYVAEPSANQVVVVDLRKFTESSRISGFTNPYWVQLNAEQTELWVADGGVNAVAVYSTANNSYIQSVSVGTNPESITFTPDATQAWVSNFGSGTISVVDALTREVVNTVTVGTNPYTMAFTKDGLKAYVADYSTGLVHVLNVAP